MGMSMSVAKRSVVAIIVAVVAFAGCARKPQEKAARFISNGKKHLKNNDYARAILEFRNAAQADPKDAEPYYQSALTNLATGDFQTGVANLRRATELNP